MGLNNAQIIERAKAKGINLSNEQADQILSQAWDQSQWGADPSKVDSLLGSAKVDATIGNSVQKTVDTVANSAGYAEWNAKAQAYKDANPFDFDTVLAEERAKATTRLDPYYEQTLNDYLTGVETKRTRSAEDERTILSEINADTDYYQGRSALTLQNAIDSSREGFADAGLLNSGQALRKEGQTTEASNASLGNFMTGQQRKTDATKLASTRLNEDLTLEERIKRRDLTQEKGYNVESQALSGTKTNLGKWNYGLLSATGAPPGVDPMTYNNSLYSFLQ